MKEKALELLKKAVGDNAEFREDQWEAIESVLSRNKTLVVEKTGWGKSIVYFIATKLLRMQGNGITILISPLLSLMRNQLEAAEKVGLKALTINSNNQEEWKDVNEEILRGECDILIISPERLANDDFRNNVLRAISLDGGIGMLVVDEAHCISDWGHDFRPDYRRIVKIVKNLPSNVPLLATTATANDRVVNDIKEQIGGSLKIIRGALMRESLKIQVIKLDDQGERLAWLYENINKMPGSGIIYCLTKNDCNKVAKWLRKKGINALEYHTSLSTEGTTQKDAEERRENMLMRNEVKALVATVKLGMGYDKPDLGFVIHYQRPGSLVAYYQQIGRAGRKLDKAYTILLNGKEDDEIQEYFIESAFPTEQQMKEVLRVIENSSFGVKKNYIYKALNMSMGRIENCLKMLGIDNAIIFEDGVYTRTPIRWEVDEKRVEGVTKQRRKELEKMKDFVELKSCYMNFIAKELDDNKNEDCHKCSNCEGEKFFDDTVKEENVIDAIKFLQGNYLELVPRKRYPAGIIDEKQRVIPKEYQNEIGRVLCSYGDAGWGRYVKEDKYDNGCFRDELVEASAELVENKWEKEKKPTWITYVPSLRKPELVKDFAKRLAKKLGLEFVEAIVKTQETKQQKEMKNSYQQAKNASIGFEVKEVKEGEPVLLIDDMVDSKWTLTICGELLKKKGAGEVYPFALASTAEGGLD